MAERNLDFDIATAFGSHLVDARLDRHEPEIEAFIRSAPGSSELLQQMKVVLAHAKKDCAAAVGLVAATQAKYQEMDRLIALMQRREISDSDLVVFDAKDVVRAGFALGYLWAQVIASQKASDFVVGKKTRKANTENSRRERERAKKPMENDPIVRGLKGIGWTPATPGRTSDSAVALRVRQWLEDNSRHPLPADRTIRKRIADLRRNPASLT